MVRVLTLLNPAELRTAGMELLRRKLSTTARYQRLGIAATEELSLAWFNKRNFEYYQHARVGQPPVPEPEHHWP